MKPFLFALLLVTVSLSPVYAQDIVLDKSSGLVQVDGRDVFYLKSINNGFGRGKDFMLSDLDNVELAYLKLESQPTNHWNSTTRRYDDDVFYGVTFSKSGNYCAIRDINVLSAMKNLARKIVAAKLIKNGQISADDEQKFVVMHGGTFLKDPNAGPAVIVNNAPPVKYGTDVPKRTADIAISGDKIYNNDELLGTFKTEERQGMQSITVYNPSDAAIIQAWRRADGTGDWDISAGTRKMTIRYHADAPLQKLFSRLVENGLFDR